jgi:hypothetical protein
MRTKKTYRRTQPSPPPPAPATQLPLPTPSTRLQPGASMPTPAVAQPSSLSTQAHPPVQLPPLVQTTAFPSPAPPATIPQSSYQPQQGSIFSTYLERPKPPIEQYKAQMSGFVLSNPDKYPTGEIPNGDVYAFCEILWKQETEEERMKWQKKYDEELHRFSLAQEARRKAEKKERKDREIKAQEDEPEVVKMEGVEEAREAGGDGGFRAINH